MVRGRYRYSRHDRDPITDDGTLYGWTEAATRNISLNFHVFYFCHLSWSIEFMAFIHRGVSADENGP